MRVISQDGMMDIQYENFSIGITGGNRITAIRDMVASPRVIADGILAKYSSKEKALKAMEMLRKAWLAESVEFENGFYNKNCVFLFPADDEVEA